MGSRFGGAGAAVPGLPGFDPKQALNLVPNADGSLPNKARTVRPT
jgi:hypothetical protein